MKQILQNLDSGETSLVDVPSPGPLPGHILIKTAKSLISAGTERMLVDFGKAGMIKKAISQPDKVKMALDKVKNDGLQATYEAVKSKLDQPLPLGYCNVGTVLDGNDTGLSAGTRIVSNGNHAEVVRVQKNLTAVIPEEVDDETASFTVLGAIAMQGVRLINPTIGEYIVVTGLGLVGLLAVQILKANGCHVLGIDFDSDKCEIARKYGAEVVDLSKGEDPLKTAVTFSRGQGVDGVLIAASSKSSDVMHQAASMCRKRGNIVLIGVVGLELNRADFYEKELTFQVSCSYGPGRYDKKYEEQGLDYPQAFVRWTEQRNFSAVLDLMSSGSIDVKPLISQSFSIKNAKEAYLRLDDRSVLGVLLDYSSSNEGDISKRTIKINNGKSFLSRKGNVVFIGGGNYASRVLIPAFKKAGANLTTLVTSGGVSAVHNAKKNGFSAASTEIEDALDSDVDTVVIATRHHLHAQQTIQSLEKNKHVFVEKPLALNHSDIDDIEVVQKISGRMVMVGYNRRFSPHVKKIKQLLLNKSEPKTFIMTMNAGRIPKEDWTQDIEQGGGRIIGEACHYIDLMCFLAGSKIKSFNANKVGKNDSMEVNEDKATITIIFEDGSMGSIHYFANGGQSFPKERIDVFCDDAVLQLDNFRKLRGFGWQGFTRMNLWKQDKGQKECSKAFMEAVLQGGASPIPQDEIFEIARVSIDIAEMLRN